MRPYKKTAISLYPMKPEDVLKKMLNTPPIKKRKAPKKK